MTAEEMVPVVLVCSRGNVTASVGDQFDWWDGTRWEIVAFSSDRIYSPSGFGGAIIVTVRNIGGHPDPITARYMDGDLSEWCGDSVGAGLFNTRATALETIAGEARGDG